jgi:hypothetical protein
MTKMTALGFILNANKLDTKSRLRDEEMITPGRNSHSLCTAFDE